MMAPLNEITGAATAAYVFGLPYIEMARTRGNYLRNNRPTGRFVHTRRMVTAADRGVTTPNNDTLYSGTWLDLAQGPVRLQTPDFGARYWSVALMAMTTENFAVPGTRTHGNRPGNFLIVGPDWQGDAGEAMVLRSPTPWVWALARIVVDGPDDMASVFPLQDGLVLTPLASQSTPSVPAPLLRDDPADFYRLLADLLIENPPSEADRAALTGFAGLGLRPGERFSTANWSADQLAALDAGFAAGVAQIAGGPALGGGRVVNGWSIPPAGIGVYGTDYGLRASVALGGLAALPPQEAMYLSATGPNLVGNVPMRVVFPPGQTPPVGAFWSLTLYEPTPQGRQFFVANTLNRYAIGDRSPDLVANPDGGLEILIQTTPPAGREANWLPAPEGRFSLNLRAYLPKPALLDGTWQPPALSSASG